MPKGEQREMRHKEVGWEKLMGGRRGNRKGRGIRKK